MSVIQGPTDASGKLARPYPASWVDRLTATVDRHWIPWWLAYLLCALAAYLVMVLVQALTGGYRPGQYALFHLWVVGNFAYLLALIHALDHSAAGALDAFRSVLRFEPAEGSAAEDFDDLAYRLTTMAPGPVMVASLLGVLLGTGIPLVLFRTPSPIISDLPQVAPQFGFSAHPASLLSMLLLSSFASAVQGVFVYHTLHQLRWIDRIYRNHAGLNLFRLQPLYAFSRTTALTAVGLAVFNYAWYGTAPALLEQPASVGLAIFFLVVTVITFAWPLYGAHRQLLAEKRRLLSEGAERFERVVGQLHARVDSGDLERMDELTKALTSLEIEQAALRRIPTWPWEPGTLRNLLAALLLPLVVWFLQTLLARALGD